MLASLMRRAGICEERGSGIDKVVFQCELYQLPAPVFEVTESLTKAILFAYKPFKDRERVERVRACYLHACLKYVCNELMTNATLRDRFGIKVQKKLSVPTLLGIGSRCFLIGDLSKMTLSFLFDGYLMNSLGSGLKRRKISVFILISTPTTPILI